MAEISVSVLNADFLKLDGLLEKFKNAGIEMVHLDVMDGCFVPNISFGQPVVEMISRHTDLPLDIHLMISNPEKYVDDFCKFGAYVGIHYEANGDIRSILKRIRQNGCKSVLTVKPGTPAEEIFDYLPLCDMVLVMSVEPGFGGQKFMPSALDKISALRNEIDKKNLQVKIEVDGGINDKTAKQCIDAGATVLVVGSYIVSAEDIGVAVNSLK